MSRRRAAELGGLVVDACWSVGALLLLGVLVVEVLGWVGVASR